MLPSGALGGVLSLFLEEVDSRLAKAEFREVRTDQERLPTSWAMLILGSQRVCAWEPQLW